MTVEFNTENQKKFEEVLTHYPTKQAAILPTLWLAQEQFGYLSMETLEMIAAKLDLAPVHVYSVASFYTMFNLKPVGKYHIQLCRTLSCALLGSESLLDHVKKKLKIEEGETTPDGKFSLCTVECLGSCGTGPAIMINEKYYESLNTEKVDKILMELK
ncbi:MAG: NADH-quinone oxidoreductase, E subunit [uncultured bacterium]|nr:MAG: NADH-quinone oxidoreductase, E subunit [uncultured bacterium]